MHNPRPVVVDNGDSDSDTLSSGSDFDDTWSDADLEELEALMGVGHGQLPAELKFMLPSSSAASGQQKH